MVEYGKVKKAVFPFTDTTFNITELVQHFVKQKCCKCGKTVMQSCQLCGKIMQSCVSCVD